MKLGKYLSRREELFTSAYSGEHSSKNEYHIFLSLVIQYVKYSFTPNLILGTKKLVAWIVDLVAKRVDRALNTISLPPTTIGNIYFVYKVLIRFQRI